MKSASVYARTCSFLVSVFQYGFILIVIWLSTFILFFCGQHIFIESLSQIRKDREENISGKNCTKRHKLVNMLFISLSDD